jgi:hypothetical protein
MERAYTPKAYGQDKTYAKSGFFSLRGLTEAARGASQHLKLADGDTDNLY